MSANHRLGSIEPRGLPCYRAVPRRVARAPRSGKKPVAIYVRRGTEKAATRRSTDLSYAGTSARKNIIRKSLSLYALSEQYGKVRARLLMSAGLENSALFFPAAEYRKTGQASVEINRKRSRCCWREADKKCARLLLSGRVVREEAKGDFELRGGIDYTAGYGC